ncbi:MAG: MFS transporter [Clostridiales bacterium]|nr:MFS transporter [Clostridiales bacterium]
MEKSQKLCPFGWVDKIGYAFGDMGCNFSFQLVTNYMYLFYTQCIGLKATTWACIIIVAKVWDAINDILIGNMVDRKRIGNKSKFKPWIIIGAVGLVVFSVMIFTPVESFSYTGKTVWCLAAYCLWSVAYTLVNVPYGSLHSVITDVPRQRTTLSTFRSIGAALPAVLVMVLPQIVYTGDSSNEGEQVLSSSRLFIVSIVFSVVALIVFLAMCKMVTERVQRKESNTKKVSYISTVVSYFTNRPLIGITIATIGVVVFYNSTTSVNNLVFQFYFGDAQKATWAMIAGYLPLVLMMPFASKISASIGKKKFICISSFISLIGGIIMLFLPITPDNKGIILYIIGLMFLNFGCCIFQIIVWAIVADCIEKSYREKGVREEASLYALYSFFRKLSQGIGSAVSALALSAVGYDESATIQASGVPENIKNLYIVFSIAAAAIITFSMQFIYNIEFKEEQTFGASSDNSGELTE